MWLRPATLCEKTLVEVFYCEFCEIFKKCLFYRTYPVAASESAGSNPICSRRTYFFYGGSRHNCQQCPPKDVVRHICQKPGYFVKVCQSKCKQATTNTIVRTYPKLGSILATSKSPRSLQKWVNALIGTSSKDSFICKKSTQEFNLTIVPLQSSVCIISDNKTAWICYS